MDRIIWSYLALSCVLALATACTGGDEPGDPPGPFSHIVLEKEAGINVGESEAIWVAAMGRFSGNYPSWSQNVKIHRLGLDPLKGYPNEIYT